MAMRLSFNLGLHHDLKPYIAKGAVTTAEADLRQTVFWAAFVVDHVWSFYLGQPFRMSMKGVSLKKPGLTASFRSSKQWTPYVSPSAVQTFTPVVDCVDEVCIHQVLLFEAMAPLSDTLYGSEATSRSSLQEINSQTVAKLHHWKGNLPVGLEVDIENREATYLPHVILLHMQYYQSIIYAYRPCMSKSYTQPQRGPGPDSARKMCVDSASTIAQLLRLYEERYTFRRINIQAVAITFSAALLLVFASIFYYHQEGEEEILADLSICFRALDELAPSWDTAKRAREFLVQLQRHWERQTRPSTVTGTRDDTSSTGSWSFSGARKRARSSLPSSEQNNDGRPTRFREETGSSFRREHWADNGNNLDSRSSATYMAANFSTDIDFDWMLASSMEVMPGNWGNIFSVPSSPRMPAYLGR
ncbi:hypothetical protein PVAG01_11479 [Phlyctema vagabunda]|uniref:Xylanolytic transcriptional activator regulatory domain-containing protein n=1 Tax=Phlyctema vagabunda TaxID=108571 RepID=A0ABR4P187_9HELO